MVVYVCGTGCQFLVENDHELGCAASVEHTLHPSWPAQLVVPLFCVLLIFTRVCLCFTLYLCFVLLVLFCPSLQVDGADRPHSRQLRYPQAFREGSDDNAPGRSAARRGWVSKYNSLSRFFFCPPFSPLLPFPFLGDPYHYLSPSFFSSLAVTVMVMELDHSVRGGEL